MTIAITGGATRTPIRYARFHVVVEYAMDSVKYAENLDYAHFVDAVPSWAAEVDVTTDSLGKIVFGDTISASTPFKLQMDRRATSGKIRVTITPIGLVSAVSSQHTMPVSPSLLAAESKGV